MMAASQGDAMGIGPFNDIVGVGEIAVKGNE
jgi:hypothetical protein